MSIPEGELPAEAVELHERGRTLCAEGDLADGLELLYQAHRLAPGWPYPPYDMAFTYLLADQLDQAERWYALVDRLAPRGFFTAKTSLATIRRERAGGLPAGFSRAYASLEWLPPPQRRQALAGLVEEFTDFAPAWKDLAGLEPDDDRKLAAIARGLASAPDAETDGVLRINQALVLSRRGQRAAAAEIVGALLDDPATTAAVEAFARAVLAQLTDGAGPAPSA
ncbi:MAG: hypothetical protein R3B06_24180 [Kofleriaceae bacterium]